MSDDGWGDDAAGGDDGWGDEAGGGDDGWGDEAGGDGDDGGWGGMEGEGLGGEGGDEEDLPVEVQIENAFYEADDMRLEDPAAAMALFARVLELGREAEPLGDEQLGLVFRSMRNMLALDYAAGRLEEMTEAYGRLLLFVPRVTRNEAQDAVNAVLHLVQDCSDPAFVRRVYEQTSRTIEKLEDQDRLWFRVNMKWAELSYAQGDLEQTKALLDALLRSCRRPDGTDDLDKGAELLEIYALDSRMSMSAKDTKRLQSLYEKTKDLQAAVKDPKSQSVIRECWGQMFGDQGHWSRAYSEFFSAFNSYQEIGDRERARRCLSYVVIANMLSGGTSDPLDAREAKAFQNEKETKAIGQLRGAYERCEVGKFTAALDEVRKARDEFLEKHLASMIRDFHARAVVVMLRSYRRVRLQFLADTLRVKLSEIEELLVQLILDGRVHGRIDQVRGLLDLTDSVGGGGAKYAALEGWASALAGMIGSGGGGGSSAALRLPGGRGGGGGVYGAGGGGGAGAGGGGGGGPHRW